MSGEREGSEDLHDSVGNGPETFQWDIDAQGWDFSGHQHHAPQSSPQRKPSHVGRRPWARRLLALATRKVRWTSDWVRWAGQIRTVRTLDRVGRCPMGSGWQISEPEISGR